MLKECLILIGFLIIEHGFCDEPKCSSKFEFEFNVLQKMVRLEETVRKLEVKLSQQQNILEKMSTDGYIGGKVYSDKGSGSNSICLSSDPSWHNYTDGIDEWRSRIYGTETDTPNIFPYPIHNQDMPCAVCRTLKSAVFMIPGRTTCYSGLKQEYTGYLMSAYHNHHGPHNYICLDNHPEFIPKGSSDDNEHILYPVESVCGSLPCPPYINGRELACVVCSV
ncbi:uncharacterized protein LOC123550066 isoform X2 [Mercenaria mercenaria]|uniref:uncharacterized protein LOC123550066 isoform X2 n=1 Tax=Mercenaria mercenaria TaxID=6596 RepID=UPI00234F13AE|nr:uncharacterized protein LOC123550066 isoform X2 [Mercenaria mercenaria]